MDHTRCNHNTEVYTERNGSNGDFDCLCVRAGLDPGIRDIQGIRWLNQAPLRRGILRRQRETGRGCIPSRGPRTYPMPRNSCSMYGCQTRTHQTLTHPIRVCHRRTQTRLWRPQATISTTVYTRSKRDYGRT
jgi:hypothetical protein